jgi:hypothetical protein
MKTIVTQDVNTPSKITRTIGTGIDKGWQPVNNKNKTFI